MGDCKDCGRPCCGKRKRTGAEWKKRWENLTEKPVQGIDAIEGGGLVSAKANDEDEEDTKPKLPPGFNFYARDGDMDGIVQDGTPAERPARTLTARRIGKRRSGEPTRTRLRDLPFPYDPADLPTVPPPRPTNTEADISKKQ